MTVGFTTARRIQPVSRAEPGGSYRVGTRDQALPGEINGWRMQDLGVLRRIVREFNGRLGLNSYVVTPGRISVGDAVELIQPS